MLRSIAIGALVLGGVAASAVGPAAAVPDEGDSVYIGSRQGYSGTGAFPIYLDTPADPDAPGEPELWAFCIEHDVSAKTRLHGTIDGFDGYLGENLFTDPVVQGKVLWILAHAYPTVSLSDLGAAAGVASLSRDDALEATQYAIWRYTDLGFDAAWPWETPASETVYHYLVDGAEAGSGMTPAELETTVAITAPAVQQDAGTLVGPFTVTTTAPVASVAVDPAIAMVDEAGAPADADAVVDGQELYLDLRAATTSGSARVTATVAGSPVAGRIVSVPNTDGGTATAADHAQTIILVAPVGATTTAEAAAAWAGETEVPVAGPTTTSGGATALAETGAPTGWPAAVAVLLIASGAAAVLARRVVGERR
ncbi:thioester domain-containing protein [Agromyces soli]